MPVDGRPVEVLLLTREECGFCDQAHDLLERLASEYPLAIETGDLDSSGGRELAARGGVLFAPGIFLDGEPFSYGRPSERRLRRELRRRLEAAQRAGGGAGSGGP